MMASMTGTDGRGRDPRLALSFGSSAAEYERGRPPYPAAAVAWLVPGDATAVADVGAGTGKLTAALGAPGRTVVAVDPDPEMLAALRGRIPGVATFEGTGESLPLADASMDAVTFGQSWHWVDPVRGSAEVARVLRPGGVLGLIWNVRDERVAWVAELSEVMHRSAAEVMVDGEGPRVAEPFGPLESHHVAWDRRMSVEDVVDMAASRSYVITADPDRRARVLAEVRTIASSVVEPDGLVTLPYVTHAFRAAVVQPAQGRRPERRPS
jgi:SAM-dependent methyltransferase